MSRHRQLWAVSGSVLLLLSICLGGCGYRISGTSGSSSTFADRSVAVPIMENATHRPNLETIVTTSLRDEIARRSGTMTVPVERADLVLLGKVTSYLPTAVAYTAEDRIRQYQASLTVEAVLKERQTGTVLWKGSVTSVEDYPVVDFPLNNQSLADRVTAQNRTALQQNSEEAAIRSLSRTLARDVFERMQEGF